MKKLILFLLKFIPKPTNIIFLDLETNGVAIKTGILEIAAMTPHRGKPNLQMRVKLNPNSVWCKGAEAVHKIPEQQARSSGYKIRTALQQLSEYVKANYKNKPLIAGFNPHFDSKILEDAYDRLGMEFPFSHRVYDLNAISLRVLETGSSTLTLNELDISFDDTLKHSALYDCQLAKAVYEKL